MTLDHLRTCADLKLVLPTLWDHPAASATRERRELGRAEGREPRKKHIQRGRNKVWRHLGEKCMKTARLVIREDFRWNQGL